MKINILAHFQVAQRVIDCIRWGCTYCDLSFGEKEGILICFEFPGICHLLHAWLCFGVQLIIHLSWTLSH